MGILIIKGHKKYGKEIINIFKMIGGISETIDCADSNKYYYIDNDDTIKFTLEVPATHYFKYEDFVEKYPFKTGDMVLIPEYESPLRITDMLWNGNNIAYKVFTDEGEWFDANELTPYNTIETNTNKKEHIVNEIISINIDDYFKGINEVEIAIGKDWELEKDTNSRIIAKRKTPILPLTYLDCCALLFPNSISLGRPLISGYKNELLTEFARLIICRDAWWKALNYTPNWNDDSIKHYIQYSGNDLIKDEVEYGNKILAFPTSEIRDQFYEKFKVIIEKVKELI
jgi:hypothetical protein